MAREWAPREVLTDQRAVPARPAPRRPVASALAAELLTLQRLAGNRVAVAEAGRIQAKLMVGSANDPAEREADEISRQVMGLLASGGTGGNGEIAEEAPVLARAIHTHTSDCADTPIGMAGGEVSTQLAGTIQSERGRGSPLPASVLQPFERAFGTDLSGVRVHHDERASELNRAVSARAFTVGNDIFLGANQYAPSSSSGQALLAHELTHTIQQGGRR